MSDDYKNRILNFLFLDPIKYIFSFMTDFNNKTNEDTTIPKLTEQEQKIELSQLLGQEYFDHFQRIIRDNSCDNQLFPIRLIGPTGSGKTALYNLLAQYYVNRDLQGQAMPSLQLLPSVNDKQSCLADILYRIIIGHCPTLAGKLPSTNPLPRNGDPNERIHQRNDSNLFHFFQFIVQQRSELPNENLLNDTSYGIMWDFDGNSTNYNIIRPYLSTSGIYILTVNLTQIIEDDDNKRETSTSKGITHLEKIKLWISSIVSLCNENQVVANDNNVQVGHQLEFPCIIIIGTHADQITSHTKLQQIYRILEVELWQDLSSLKNHICVPRISFDLNPNHSIASMIDINANSYRRLYSLIHQISEVIPLLKKRMEVCWYVVALILYHYKWKRRPADVMSVDQIRQLIQEFAPTLAYVDITEMLGYFHEIGLLFLNKREDNEIDVVSIGWLSTVLHHLTSQDNSQHDHLWMLNDMAQYHQLKETGRVTKIFLNELLKDNLRKSNINYYDEQTIQLLRDIGAIYPIGTDNTNDQCQEYFVPHFLPPAPSNYNLSNFHYSDKVYILFEKDKHQGMHCIPPELFYHLLSTGFVALPNYDIKIYQRANVTYINKYDFYLIMEMDQTSISVQFVYQILQNVNDQKRPRYDNNVCSTLIKILTKAITDHIPRLKDFACSFNIKCSNCYKFTSVGHKFTEGRLHVAVKCFYCKYSNEVYLYIPQ